MTYGLFEAGPFGQKPIQISVRGAEVDELDRISRDLMQAMGKMKGVADLETSLEKAKPELRVRVDRDRASDLGVPAGRHRHHPARGGGGRGGLRHRGRERRQPRRAGAPARRPAPLRRRPPRPHRAHRQGRRQPGQAAGAPARDGGGGARHRALDHPPQGPRARGAGQRQPGRPLAGRDHHRHRGRGQGPRHPARLRHPDGRRRGRAEGHVREHDAGPLPGRGLHLPDPGQPVRVLHPAVRDHALAAVVARGRGPGPAHDRRQPEHHEHDRSHHAHGPGDQERHPARGLREPRAARGAWAATRPSSRRAPRGCGRS